MPTSAPRVRRQRRASRRAMAGIDPEHVAAADATGADTAMARTYGRAPRGQRVKGGVPGPWKSVALIAWLRPSAVVAPMALEGAMDAPTSRSYVGRILKPRPRPGDVVIRDDLKPHEGKAARAPVEQARARAQPLPPCSPDLTPGERLRSKAKGGVAHAGGPGAGGGVRGDADGLWAGEPARHPGPVPGVRPVRNASVNRNSLLAWTRDKLTRAT